MRTCFTSHSRYNHSIRDKQSQIDRLEIFMSKKIVILNGSPRKYGNTAALVFTFAKGAKEAGNQVTEFFLDQMNINGCKGCFWWW